MSVPDDYSVTKNVCSTTQPVLRTYNCRSVTSTKYNDGIPYTSSSTVCDRDLGPPVTKCGNQTTKYKWNGCAGSRAYPLNTQDGGYLVRIPGIMNVSCPSELLELTPSQPKVLATIKGLTAADETYIPSGLIWGWRALSAGEPFAEPLPDPDD
jgi:hypothetical protein